MAPGKRWVQIGLAIAGLALVGYLVKDTRYLVFWDNFGVVEPGRLYRSGQLQSYQLRRAIEKYGLRSVVNLAHREAEDEAEEKSVTDLGVRYFKASWHGDGVVPEEDLRWAYDLISDPQNQPALVHCARGTRRTGAVIAYWRILASDWSREQIREEMNAHRFRPSSSPHLEALVDRLFAAHRGGVSPKASRAPGPEALPTSRVSVQTRRHP